ncbi:MAG: hypothetical protein PHX30_05675 [Candidatus Pacebacteria bacterium]|nr:hypothetical protein [Candidatus Paceibacterota bacterium]
MLDKKIETGHIVIYGGRLYYVKSQSGHPRDKQWLLKDIKDPANVVIAGCKEFELAQIPIGDILITGKVYKELSVKPKEIHGPRLTCLN